MGARAVNGGTKVSFSLERILGDMNNKLDTLTELLHQKTDRAEAIELRERITKLEQDVTTAKAVETNSGQIDNLARATRHQWVAIGLSIVGTIATVVVHALWR